MIRTRIYSLLIATSLAFAAPAFAQPVESVPLSQPSYTLQTETDPMAMDPGSITAPDEKVLYKGTAAPATPPPGVNHVTGTATEYDSAPAGTVYAPSNEAYPSGIQTTAPAASNARSSGYSNVTPPANNNPDATPAGNFPNNSVSGVVKSNERSFENRTWCTLKVSFTSIGTGINAKAADKIKTYLDSQSQILTYKKATWGKEGEFDYCIDIPKHNVRAKTYTAIKRLLPPKDSRDTRTVLTGKGFSRVENSF